MHYAYPARKNSNPPPFKPRRSKMPSVRKNHIKLFGSIFLTIFALWYLFSGNSNASNRPKPRVVKGEPPVVVVTAFDSIGHSQTYLKNIEENRLSYAKKNGYGTFFAKAGDYDLNGAPMSWTKVVAMRHAMAKYPEAKFFWYIDQNSMIMDPNVKPERDILTNDKLDKTIIRDHSIVPPDGIIKTFGHLRGEDIDLAITQDAKGVVDTSFVIRNGEWAKFFLDTWFDPLYRSYNFQRADTHALEHIIQWHPTILSRLGLLPQRTINSYQHSTTGAQYQEGDFILTLNDCTASGERSCNILATPYVKKWRQKFGIKEA
ncbi:putative alpha-1,6-mannosyltransferase mnn11 [Ceratocystis pirilliformis]|uniref:Alpha-1,6-mannosyltransferase mnn11 n=1 Tax=Ceratocystis pirilliformis TaxID=259994 RepID=A0ABR3ZBM8_9PEZI